jgi:hypothetical protein
MRATMLRATRLAIPLLLLAGCGGGPGVRDRSDTVETPLVGACEPGDHLELVGYEQEGRELFVRVRHGGGCDRHTYVACLEEPHPHAPPVFTLRFHHDAHGDVCRAELTRTLRIELDQDLSVTSMSGGALQLE